MRGAQTPRIEHRVGDPNGHARQIHVQVLQEDEGITPDRDGRLGELQTLGSQSPGAPVSQRIVGRQDPSRTFTMAAKLE